MMRFTNKLGRLASIAMVWIACLAAPVFAYEISSSAIVNNDGSLRIKGKTVSLYGIYIPETNQTCKTYRIPPACGSRAAVALDFKISGFVRCEVMSEHNKRSVVGRCRVNASKFDDGDDLSAYLLQKGWAVALPDAPFEYQTLEKIARTRGFGVWGMPVDRIIDRP